LAVEELPLAAKSWYDSPAVAILAAQWRAMLNFYRKPQMGGYWVGTVVFVVWYLILTGLAVLVALALARPKALSFFREYGAFALLAGFLYWQVVPVFLASTGLSLDLRKLKVYPIPLSQLFHIEVLLRLSTGIDVLIIMAGAGVGLMMNPLVPKWAPPTLLVFVAFNLYLSAGIRDLVGRLMERKGVREISVLVLVTLMVTPQLLALVGLPPWIKNALAQVSMSYFPWSAAADLASGQAHWYSAPLMVAWTAGAYFFGRWQFDRSLHFDAETLRAEHQDASAPKRFEFLFRWPAALFSDPLAAMVEKELRVLSRAPRFRLVFFMGFTFGLVVWLPITLGRNMSDTGMFAQNYLTWMSIYSVMLLGEVALFNHFGFDRAAAQFYWVAPVPLRSVLLAKNIAVSVFIFLEISLISTICLILRLPVAPNKVLEALAVTVILAIFFAALGNIGSLSYPRPANPAQAWRSRSGGKFQMVMLLAYPALSIPIGLAYVARYAFESDLAFYLMLLFTATLASIFYWVAMDSAVAQGLKEREAILDALSKGDGMIS
jgi:ABC-2 type transport system permease protein